MAEIDMRFKESFESRADPDRFSRAPVSSEHKRPTIKTPP